MRSSATLNDILASAGLADAAAMQRLLAQWEAILQRLRPDLVVAEFAPIAALAARGRVPLVLVGSGYTLPPSEMPRFPPLHRASAPQWREEETLAAVNAAARALGRAPLQRLPQLFCADARVVLTFDLFDPYHTQRVDEVDGPLLERDVPQRREAGDLIFAYLSGGYDIPAGLADALRRFGPRVVIHAPRLRAEDRDGLARSGARIESEPVAVAEILPLCRLVLHRGGHGLACEALLAGVPQLVLSGQIEQTLNGAALQLAGVGKLVEAYRPSAAVPAALIEAMLDDAGMAERAAAMSCRCRARLFDRDPALKCERACLDLMGN
jgi:UDP:flavonoid glycosyltransferase YjiC (YdhE family)